MAAGRCCRPEPTGATDGHSQQPTGEHWLAPAGSAMDGGVAALVSRSAPPTSLAVPAASPGPVQMTDPSPASAAVPPPQPPASTVLAVARIASFVRGAVERRVLEPAGMSWSAFAALAAIVEAPEPIRMHVVAE